MSRTAQEVIESHLKLRADGDLDRDREENYHPDVVFLTARKVYRGHDGVRKSAHHLWKAVSDGGDYAYQHVLVDDRMALLEWQAATDEIRISCGVDSYLIEDGLITAQTIHYRVESLELSVSAEVLSRIGERGPSMEDGDDGARMEHLTSQ
jgi:hypothetical protein